MSPFWAYLKLGAAVAVIALVAFFTWQIRGLQAEHDQQEAVEKVTREAQARLNTEVRLRVHYQDLADTRLEELLKSITNIKLEHKTITNNITKEIEIHREFYDQALPEGGYEQWRKSRALASGASSPP